MNHRRFSSTPATVEDKMNAAESKGKHSPSSTSLARALACLPEDESPTEKELTRMEVKRSLENRIKKRVKDQFSRGKFHNLMDAVIVNGDTLRDAYDIIRLDSNVDLSSSGDDGLCFLSIAGELNGDGRLVLPNLKLRIIQEAVRVALEVVYRPHFSKLSHGGRSGRGHRSALRYVSREVGGDIDWWFTLPMNAQADINIVSKLISMMEEKIEDAHLFFFIRELFQAEVLNLRGSLSILMNIYLDALDQELLRISMRYECLGDDPSSGPQDGRRSKLRTWLRRRITGGSGGRGEETVARFHACRFMDEVFIAIRGTRDSACSLRDEILEFLRSSLFIEPGHLVEVLSVEACPQGLQFLGMALRVVTGGGGSGGGGGPERTRAVHKLRNKVRSFAYHKKDSWEALTARLGKKCLAHGLKKLKESEIRPLRRSTPVLDQISRFRKEGMKTDHWFKTLLKVWLQDVGGAAEADEEAVLRKLFAEQALPEDLREAFLSFQLQVEGYLLAENVSTQELLSEMRKEYGGGGGAAGDRSKMVVVVEAPMRFIERRLLRYGLVDRRGNPRCVHELVLQDDALIVSWFAGLARRWLRWFADAANFRQVEATVAGRLRRSCVRTLAVKAPDGGERGGRRFAEELAATPLAGGDSNSGDLLAGGDSGSGDLLTGEDEALTYGVAYGGLCALTLERVAVPCRRLRCSVVGCSEGSPAIYALRVKERQSFPGWKTGFSPAIFLGLTRRRVALCRRHVEDIYLGLISLRAVDFGSLN
ncbi:unnamed protein product [Spirodela intermedia]|uniref:Domain X domain-containing protein n=1 Tax=Spirodela intermedia TaxID=51605 RepID=A0A7I8IVB4_SPIIN|nr:unnamed protein product [Spirodela intermedia]CAA6661513.1 unnamed protein product [Spirodela intermedia]